MPASIAITGKKAELAIETGPSIFTPIPAIIEIGDLNFARVSLDTTTHGAGVYREQILGPMNQVELPLTFIYLPDRYDDFWVWIFDETPAMYTESYRLKWPDSSAHFFNGSIVLLSTNSPLDGLITSNATMLIDGEIAYGLA